MSRGPIIPVKCSTIELKDLADIEGFDEEADQGSVFGFELNDNGIYVRKEIEEKKQQFPKLEQLRNLSVGGDNDGILHKIKKRNNRWILTAEDEQISWLIKFEFYSPYTMITPSFDFRKCLNQGRQLVSLVSSGIKVKPYQQDSYVLYSSDNSILEFKPAIALGNTWTIIIDIIVSKHTAGSPREVRASEIVNGVLISWTTSQDKRINVCLQKNNGAIIVKSTDPVVTINTTSMSNTIETMNIKNVELVGFYYTTQVLSDDLLTQLTSNIN